MAVLRQRIRRRSCEQRPPLVLACARRDDAVRCVPLFTLACGCHAVLAGCRDMLESEAKDGHRGVFELLHLSDKASGSGMASLSPREFPLYYGGKELKPFQYALFLLSKVGTQYGRLRVEPFCLICAV